ncbi:ankyrin repeat domain-containing protein 52 [Nannizzia gypsea CBS 118893]|uniref:Ankyrin repeat domain-containing protein 52 n=1 Tax=Arthroderma gypseum (strain ATCC MYA-4604 / CBS 118893) TaxID=535722 RepID=E4UZF3_ARTGP|nr:ankyrin repeat domain-containing protein 52 [Nannizzia gypsea CBS 118893]EFR03483.1 ankyrin repeat domain-containing protein 52 [Nannizzia gypsea CBS 118893]
MPQGRFQCPLSHSEPPRDTSQAPNDVSRQQGETIQDPLALADTSSSVSPNGSLFEAFEKATKTFNLCPNRVWAVAGKALPELLPVGKPVPSHSGHDHCEIDHCQLSSLDSTKLPRRHECNDSKCEQLRVFPEDKLEEATWKGKSTVWALDGRTLLDFPRPFMAISHVWSDGTGAGHWRQRGEGVNSCLYSYFKTIAEQFQCEGIWWDTISIPDERAARAQAIRDMQRNYQYSRVTLVHDCFLRNWEWIDAETSCFAILMSPWFSRGWTALELAESRKVKVIFKGPYGRPLIKDLDEDILAKSTDSEISESHRISTNIIRNLRDGITTLNDLLATLGSRYTSVSKDKAIIASLLLGVNIQSKNRRESVLESALYTRILEKFHKISHGHLYHGSATMTQNWIWCPTSLFNMPTASNRNPLVIENGGDLVGEWKLVPVDNTLSERYSWDYKQPVLTDRIQHALKRPERYVLLIEPDLESPDKGLLVEAVESKGETGELHCRYIGGLSFSRASLKQYIKETKAVKEMQVRILSNMEEAKDVDRPAWDLVQALDNENSAKRNSALVSGTDEMEAKSEVDQSNCSNEEQKAEGSSLVSAAKAGSEEHVYKCLSLGVDPNYQDEYQWTALHYATLRGHSKVIKLLLSQFNADANTQDRLGQQALHLAAERGNCKVVELLCEYTKDPQRTFDGETTLHRAAWGGSLAVVDFIINFLGESISARDAKGRTALHLAAEKGFEPVVALLLEKMGSELDIQDMNGVTPFYYAVANGHELVSQLLADKGANVLAKDCIFGWTPLHCAAAIGHEAIVHMLLRKETDVNAKDQYVQWTPLHFAAMNGHFNMVKLLVEKQAKVNASDREGWTPRQLAEVKRHTRVASYLIEKGDNGKLHQMEDDRWMPQHCFAVDGQSDPCQLLKLERDLPNMPLLRWVALTGLKITFDFIVTSRGGDIEAKGEDGYTLLQWAVLNGLEGVFSLLTKYDVNMRVESKSGEKLIHLAVSNRHDTLVKLLIGHGAFINATDNDTMTPLHYAVRNQDQAVVELLVNSGANIDAKARDGSYPLYLSVRYGYEKIAKFLIAKGASTNILHSGWTLLITAAHFGHEAVARLLVDEGLDVDAKDNEDLRVLVHAAIGGNERVVLLLIDKGADINKADSRSTSSKRTTLLHYASKNGHREVVERLLDKGADVNAWDNDSKTPLYEATSTGHKEIAMLLLGRGSMVTCGNRSIYPQRPGSLSNATPLHNAAAAGMEEVVDLLIKKGADVEAMTDDGERPIHCAARRGEEETVRMLIRHKAKLKVSTKEQYYTPLHLAADFGHDGVIEVLIDSGADIEAKSREYQYTPLHLAAKSGHERVVKLLIQRGAGIEVKTVKTCFTPLHLAAQYGHERVVELLLENGADTKAEDDDPGWGVLQTFRLGTPLHVAAAARQEGVVKLLIEKGVNVDAINKNGNTPLEVAITKSKEDVARDITNREGVIAEREIQARNERTIMRLIESGADIRLKQKEGWTPLHGAASQGYVAVARLLLKKGANIEAKREKGGYSGWDSVLVGLILEGMTPLHTAAQCGQKEMAELLLEEGASIDAMTKEGATPLHLAAWRGRLSIIELLLDKGAYIEAKSDKGYTPLHVSSFEGELSVVELLVHRGADINARSRFKKTPLHFAKESRGRKAFDFLVANGAGY